MVLDPKQLGAGLCSQYEHRGMICRLFGYSARLNKYNRKELITCKVIKTEQAENYISASAKINVDGEVPVMSEFYLKLYYIDPFLANEFMPINKAIQWALELTGQYFNYKKQEI